MTPGGRYNLIWCVLLCGHVESSWDWCFFGCECNGTTTECRGLDREYFPRDLEPNTEVLRIRDSKIKYIPRNALSRLVNLRVLEISSSRIKYIQTCAFSGVTDFTSIKFTNISVENIVQNAFSVLHRVGELVFEDSHIQIISSQAFSHLRDVGTFRLTNLTVIRLQREAVDNASNIPDVQVQGSKFSFVGQSPFKNLQNVTMNISRNVFPSQCGVQDIIRDVLPDTNVTIYFNNNAINECACGRRLLGDQQPEFVSMERSTCLGPPEIAGISVHEIEETPFCAARGTVPTVCPVTRQMVVVHDCHAFGDPLIPQDEVVVPSNDKSKEAKNSSTRNVPSSVLLCPLLIAVALSVCIYT